MPIVCLDPGHGGRDPGACGQGSRESDIALKVSLKVRDLLRAKGITVVMTRETDIFVELSTRVQISDNAKANRFVAIHVNAGGGKGAEVLCYLTGGNSQKLAQAIADQVCAIMGIHGSKLKDGSWVYVVKNTDAPACLVELGFIDTSDLQKILANIDALAKAIYVGICNDLGIDSSINTPTPEPPPPTPTGPLYRIRKTWEDSKSQIGAYRSLDSAKQIADQNPGYFVFDESGKVVYPIAQPAPTHMYRVRKSWEDAKSQIGAFAQLENAKVLANQNSGYSVFDENGQRVYTPPVTPATPPVVVTPPTPEPVVIKHPVMGKAEITIEQAETYLHEINPEAPYYVAIYKEEGEKEGVRWDIAFAQTLKETNYFRFGGDALPEWNNFAGIGVTGAKYDLNTATEKVFVEGVITIWDLENISVGVKFATPQLGIRAQIQHLKAYASTDLLVGQCVDPRFKYVQRGKAPNIEDFGSGVWAADTDNYGGKILDLVEKMKATVGQPIPEPPKPEPENPPTSEVPSTSEPIEVVIPPETVSAFRIVIQFIIDFVKKIFGRK